MRFLLFFLLSSVAVHAQDGSTHNNKYVWAKAGLVLRAEGSPRGEKLAVIPYGTAVRLTGERGEELSIEVIPKQEIHGTEMPGWAMPGQFVGVLYGDLKGFVFSGYISNYNPANFPVDSLGSSWFSKTEVDTLLFSENSQEPEYGKVSLLYPNGITNSMYWDEAGGGGTIVVPNADLASGYLLALKLFGLDQHYPEHSPEENPHLYAKTNGSLSFRHELTEVTIREYFGVVIIVYDTHC